MANSDPGQVVDFDTLDIKDQQLVKRAVEARERAYCPISKFQVGAAIRTKDEITFTGCNVESYAFSPTICAERTAICKAVSEGCRNFDTVAIAAFLENTFVPPCGVCRQMLVEFCAENTLILLANPDMKKIYRVQLRELMPLAFTKY